MLKCRFRGAEPFLYCICSRTSLYVSFAEVCTQAGEENPSPDLGEWPRIHKAWCSVLWVDQAMGKAGGRGACFPGSVRSTALFLLTHQRYIIFIFKLHFFYFCHCISDQRKHNQGTWYCTAVFCLKVSRLHCKKGYRIPPPTGMSLTKLPGWEL